MKFLIVLALTLASCCASPSSKEIKSRHIVVPAGQPTGRITNGKNAATKQFPYTVALSVKHKNGKIFRCGGSLLNNEWVLTAAHCTIDIVAARALLGATNRQSPEITHQVTKNNFIVHENFDADTLENDIALIKIPHTKYTDKIKKVKLPAMRKSYASYAGDDVITVGWGRINDKTGENTEHLQWARLSVIPRKICEKSFDIFASNLCTATIDGVNICDGDSGGPLVLESNGEQIGIASFTDKLCAEGTPGVFTLVSSFLPWIEKHTKIGIGKYA